MCSSDLHDGLAALRQIDRQRQPDRPGADHDDRILGHISARPILIGLPAIAELGFRLRHATSQGRATLIIVASATILNPVRIL